MSDQNMDKAIEEVKKQLEDITEEIDVLLQTGYDVTQIITNIKGKYSATGTDLTSPEEMTKLNDAIPKLTIHLESLKEQYVNLSMHKALLIESLDDFLRNVNKSGGRKKNKTLKKRGNKKRL